MSFLLLKVESVFQEVLDNLISHFRIFRDDDSIVHPGDDNTVLPDEETTVIDAASEAETFLSHQSLTKEFVEQFGSKTVTVQRSIQLEDLVFVCWDVLESLR